MPFLFFYFSLDLSLNFYGNPDLALAWKIVAIAVNVIVMAFALVMSFYILTQAALYDLPMGKLIKNAFWLTVSFVIQNVIMLVFSLVPVALLLLCGSSTFLNIIIFMVLAMVGFSYIACVWTIYTHYVYGMLFTAVADQNNGGKKKHKKAKAK